MLGPYARTICTASHRTTCTHRIGPYASHHHVTCTASHRFVIIQSHIQTRTASVLDHMHGIMHRITSHARYDAPHRIGLFFCTNMKSIGPHAPHRFVIQLIFLYKQEQHRTICIASDCHSEPCGKQHFREIATPDRVRTFRTCEHTHQYVCAIFW